MYIWFLLLELHGSFVEAPLKMKGKMESGSPVRNNFVTAAHSWARCPQWKRIHDRLRTVMCVFCLVNLLLGRVCRGFYCPASLPVSKCQRSGETRQSVCELKCRVTEGNCCFSTPNIDVWCLILHFPLTNVVQVDFHESALVAIFPIVPWCFEYNQVSWFLQLPILFNFFLVVFSRLVLFSSLK